MKHKIYRKWLFLLAYVVVLVSPSVASADATDGGGHHRGTEAAEIEAEISLIGVGDAKSSVGNASVGTAGVIIETEYEKNNMVYSFNYERWKYNWTNPENLPFISGTTANPWSTFNTLQFGFGYEQELTDHWELVYIVEAESSFEKETSNSNEYELGIDIEYKPSGRWAFVLNGNYEYLDATGGEFGMDLEILWNHHSKEGWSGEIEISSEFPESNLNYHFTRAFSMTLFYGEGGTSTIRLANDTPVTGMQGGYLEDEYQSIGTRFSYELAHESYLSFSIQKNFNRQLTFIDGTGSDVETNYSFEDAIGATLSYELQF